MTKWFFPCLVLIIAVSATGCRHSEELVLVQEQELQAPSDPGFGYQAKGQGMSLEEWVKFTGGWAPEGTGAKNATAGMATAEDDAPVLQEMEQPELIEVTTEGQDANGTETKEDEDIPSPGFQIIPEEPAQDVPEVKILADEPEHVEKEYGMPAVTGQGEIWISEEKDAVRPEEEPHAELESKFEGGAVIEASEDISEPGPVVSPDVIDMIRKSAEEAQQERPSLFQTLLEKYFFIFILICFSLIVFGLARVMLITSGGRSGIKDRNKKHKATPSDDSDTDKYDYSVNLTGIHGGSVAAISRTLGGADMESVQKSAEEIMIENERKRNPDFEWSYIDPVSPPPEGVENEKKIIEMFNDD